MLKKIAAATLLALAAAPLWAQNTPAPVVASSPAKKELVQKILALQQAGLDNMSRNMVEQPAMQLMQAAAGAIRAQVPADKQEAIGRSVEADVRKFVDEAVPLVRERAGKLTPAIYGAGLEEKFTEDELKQLLAWLESPVNKKFQQTVPDLQKALMQKLVSEAAPLIDPKLQVLQQKVRATIGADAGAAAPAAPAGSAPAARAARPAAKPASK